jgi:cleavage stimulation factor subunit 2
MVRDITHKSERTANVDTGGTEELITETLGRVGHVNNFRLVYDKETGRPKGFGFAEFADADAAASAVRNLNDYDIMGRKLRVDWSNDNGAGDNAPPGHVPAAMPPAHSAQPTNGQAPEPAPSSALGPLPPGADLPPNLTCPDAISRTLSTLPPDQLMDILSQMKGLVMTDPLKATELLRQAPQLAYAIFQSLLLLDLVNPQMLGALVETAPPVAAPARRATAPELRVPATAAACTHPPTTCAARVRTTSPATASAGSATLGGGPAAGHVRPSAGPDTRPDQPAGPRPACANSPAPTVSHGRRATLGGTPVLGSRADAFGGHNPGQNVLPCEEVVASTRSAS